MTRVFLVPMMIALASCVGLIVALTGDGWRDTVSWVALIVPVATLAWAIATRRS